MPDKPPPPPLLQRRDVQTTGTPSRPDTPRASRGAEAVPPSPWGGWTEVVPPPAGSGVRYARLIAAAGSARVMHPPSRLALTPAADTRPPAISAPRAHWDNRARGGPGARGAEPEVPMATGCCLEKPSLPAPASPRWQKCSPSMGWCRLNPGPEPCLHTKTEKCSLRERRPRRLWDEAEGTMRSGLSPGRASPPDPKFSKWS